MKAICLFGLTALLGLGLPVADIWAAEERAPSRESKAYRFPQLEAGI